MEPHIIFSVSFDARSRERESICVVSSLAISLNSSFYIQCFQLESFEPNLHIGTLSTEPNCAQSRNL